jgi:hypothetical protein
MTKQPQLRMAFALYATSEEVVQIEGLVKHYETATLSRLSKFRNQLDNHSSPTNQAGCPRLSRLSNIFITSLNANLKSEWPSNIECREVLRKSGSEQVDHLGEMTKRYKTSGLIRLITNLITPHDANLKSGSTKCLKDCQH